MARSRSNSSRSSSLVCPSCGREYPPQERFCSVCDVPLVQSGDESLEVPLNDAHERARKINPVYAQGRLVRVAGGRNQAEAELIQGLLLTEGVPSMLRRTAGFDVPDFLAAGPRDVLVPEAGVPAARELLLQAELAPTEAPPGSRIGPRPWLLVGAIVGGGAVAALVAWLAQGGG